MYFKINFRLIVHCFLITFLALDASAKEFEGAFIKKELSSSPYSLLKKGLDDSLWGRYDNGRLKSSNVNPWNKPDEIPWSELNKNYWSQINISSKSNNICNVLYRPNLLYVGSYNTKKVDAKYKKYYFPDFKSALNFAEKSPQADKILISPGVYSPEKDGLLSYHLPDNVHLQAAITAKSENEAVIFQSSSSASPIFEISSSRTVVFEGIIFRKDNAESIGDSNFFDVVTQTGGAINARDSNITVCDSNFKHNIATDFGGAIYLNEGSLTVSGSTFEDNRVLKGINEMHDQLDEADTDGGAISVHNVSEFIVENSLFISNTAGDDGGAIDVRFSNVEISTSAFYKNRAIAKLQPNSNPVFTDDLVTGFGGAVSIHNESIGGDQSKVVSLKDNYFLENSSGIAGGVFLLSAPGSVTTVKGNVFAKNGGDGVAQTEGEPNQIGVEFGKGAGAICLIGLRGLDLDTNADGSFVRGKHVIYMEDNHFLYNMAGYGGSVVALGSDIFMEQTSFYRNTARTRGGAIWNQNFLALLTLFSGIEPELGVLKVNKSLFVQNQTLGVLERLQFQVFPDLISEPEQPFGGGAIGNNQAGVLEVEDSLFYANRSIKSDGGAIHNAVSPITSLSLAGQEATYAGVLKVRNSLFIGNKSINGSGGAISAGGNQVNGSILDSSENDIREDSVGSLTDITKTFFFNNLSTGFGGAIANWNNGKLKIENSGFFKNVASSGGAVSSIVFSEALNESLETNRNNSFLKNKANDKASRNIFTQLIQ